MTDKYQSDIIEISKRLLECADWLEYKAVGLHHEDSLRCKQWANDIQRIVIPEPINANS